MLKSVRLIKNKNLVKKSIIYTLSHIKMFLVWISQTQNRSCLYITAQFILNCWYSSRKSSVTKCLLHFRKRRVYKTISTYLKSCVCHHVMFVHVTFYLMLREITSLEQSVKSKGKFIDICFYYVSMYNNQCFEGKDV